MIVKRKKIRKLDDHGYENLVKESSHDSGPGFSSSSSSYSYSSEKSFSNNQYNPKNLVWKRLR